MEPVRLSCDGCGARIRVRNVAAGRDLACPRCDRAISVRPDPEAAGLAGPPPSHPGDPTPIRSVERARPPRRLATALDSAAAALIVCAALALFVTTSARLTPRLIGRDLDPSRGAETGSDERADTAACSRRTQHKQAGDRVFSEETWLLTEAPRVEPIALAAVDSAPDRPGAPAVLLRKADGREESATPPPARPSPPGGTTLPARPNPKAPQGDETRGPAPPPPPRAARATGAKEPPPPPGPAQATAEKPAAGRRIRVRDMNGRPVVSRFHGGQGRNSHILLPDGQLGIPDTLIYTEEPFVPATAAEIEADLLSGLFAGFKSRKTAHYVLLYQSSDTFAEESGRVLESLYKGLMEAFHRFEVPVKDAEFPLVAVIFATEADFRAHKRVDRAVQAYYEIYTNRIYFYESSERDEQAPEVAALRRPQTIAHEGTHQIVQNVGIQPRLAAWPPWLIEGLAEYCAAPATTKKGPTWSGIGVVNGQHVATIRDLDDPLSGQVPGNTRPEHIGRPPGMPLVEYLVTKSELSPTDYALAWGMTHYLAMKHTDEFVTFLRKMGEMPPLRPRTPADQLASFREAFGSNLVKLDKDIGRYLSKIKVNDRLPFYAVMFEQRVPSNLIRRAAIVSQSPSTILQWLQTVTSPRGDAPTWTALPHTSRTRAYVTAEQFMRGF